MIASNRMVFETDNKKLMKMLLVVFWAGALTLVASALGAFVAIIYLVNLTLDAITELVGHLSVLYTSSDSLGKLIIWLVGLYLLCKIAPWVTRSLRKSFSAVRAALSL